jgi:hypothetical protein
MEIIKKDLRQEAGVSTTQDLWQHKLLRVCGTNLEILTLGGLEHALITVLEK